MAEITIYDWRSEGSGVIVSFDGDSCYNIGEPACPSDWDVSIVSDENGLTEGQENMLRAYLAESVNQLLSVKQAFIEDKP